LWLEKPSDNTIYNEKSLVVEQSKQANRKKHVVVGQAAYK